MAKSVDAGPFSWRTRTEARQDFTSILRDFGYQPGQRITDNIHDQKLRAIVSIHPRATEKIGPGIAYFTVDLLDAAPGRRVAAGDIAFWIHRSDGTVTDFSFNEAITPADYPKKVADALRTAVDDLRLGYRDSRLASGSYFSDISGSSFADKADACVIYENPTFAQMAFRFSESEGGWGAIDIDNGGAHSQIGPIIVDAAVRDRWREFYERHGRPSLATKSESARRPRPKVTEWAPPTK